MKQELTEVREEFLFLLLIEINCIDQTNVTGFFEDLFRHANPQIASVFFLSSFVVSYTPNAFYT